MASFVAFLSEEIAANMASQVQVITALRQNRKIIVEGESHLVPTQSVRLTFEGCTRPDHVILYVVSHLVSQFYSPVKMCFNCLIFGHIQSQCNSRAKCAKCGNSKHENDDSCRNEGGPARCANCKGPHALTDKSCPSCLREKRIHALAVKHNISFRDAKASLIRS